MTITIYNITIPETAMICSTWPSPRRAGERWPDNWLDKKYGGYVVEDNGIIVMACDDEFCAQIEEAEKKAGLFPEEYGLETSSEEPGITPRETTAGAQSFDQEEEPTKA